MEEAAAGLHRLHRSPGLQSCAGGQVPGCCGERNLSIGVVLRVLRHLPCTTSRYLHRPRRQQARPVKPEGLILG